VAERQVRLEDVPYPLLENFEFGESALRLRSVRAHTRQASSRATPSLHRSDVDQTKDGTHITTATRLTFLSQTNSTRSPRYNQTRNRPPVSGAVSGWRVILRSSGVGNVRNNSVWTQVARGALGVSGRSENPDRRTARTYRRAAQRCDIA